MKLFQPAIALMHRLKYPQKFLLISLLFILPLGLVLRLMFSEIDHRIRFSQKELLGSQYLVPVRQIRQSVGLHRLTAYQANASTRQTLSILQAEIDDALQRLVQIDQRMGQILRTDDRVAQLKETWQKLKTSPSVWDSSLQAQYNQLLQQLDRLRAHVGDTSNLILDPALDTYYLMDASLIKLPEMQATLIELEFISTQIVKQNNKVTFDERGRLLALASVLQDTADRLEANLRVGFANNPAGNMKPRLEAPLETLTQDASRFVKQLKYLVVPDTQPEPELYRQLAATNLQDSFKLWDQVVQELDYLLEQRIQSLVDRKRWILALVAIVLTLVVYLLVGFYQAVMQTVYSLEETSQRMMHGHFDRLVALDSRDELAQVVTSFNNVAAALVKAEREIRNLNQKLSAENFRMSTELAITRKLQEMILPKDQELAAIPDLDIAGFMKPAAEVGGDYYDVLQNNGLVKIGIGDVTGHGLESGVLMIMVQTAVRTLMVNQEDDPVKFLNTLNETIYGNVQRMNSDKNLTLALLDYHKGQLKLSGQHEEMILVRAGGTIERIDTIDLGFPIGLESDISPFVDQRSIVLRSGDVVALYTDGVTEAENSQGELYGLDRLCDVIRRCWSQTAAEIRQTIIEDIQAFVGKHKIYDDITLLIIKQR